MLEKVLKIIVVLTFIVVTTTLLYTSFMGLFFDVSYEKNYALGCFTYYLSLTIIIFIQRIKSLNINNSLLYSILLFNFLASILGELFNFYYRFALWDNMLHIIAGVLISLLMLNIFFAISDRNLVEKYPKLFIFLFIVGCTITIGVFWECYEFFMDTFFDYNMQKTFFANTTTNFFQYVDASGRFVAPSLVDTMIDLISESITAIFTASLIVIYGPIKFYNKFLNQKNTVE